jgi:hypothetical protein
MDDYSEKLEHVAKRQGMRLEQAIELLRTDITTVPERWQEFTDHCAAGKFGMAFSLTGDRYFVDLSDAPDAFRVWAAGSLPESTYGGRHLRGGQWWPKPKPADPCPPHWSTNAGAAYQVNHLVAFEQPGEAMQVLRRYHLHVRANELPEVTALMRTMDRNTVACSDGRLYFIERTY